MRSVARRFSDHVLAEAILTMYRMSKEEREAMGRRGREYCEVNFAREMLIGWKGGCGN